VANSYRFPRTVEQGRAERPQGAGCIGPACVLELGRIRLQDRAPALLGDARVARLYMGMSSVG